MLSVPRCPRGSPVHAVRPGDACALLGIMTDTWWNGTGRARYPLQLLCRGTAAVPAAIPMPSCLPASFPVSLIPCVFCSSFCGLTMSVPVPWRRSVDITGSPFRCSTAGCISSSSRKNSGSGYWKICLPGQFRL